MIIIAKIKVLRAADKDMLRSLARAGTCTNSHFQSYGNSKNGISFNRVQQHIRDGLIATDKYLEKETNRYQDCYVLTSKGAELAKERLGVDRVYGSTSRVHDIALMDKYTSLDSREQDTWRTESDVRYEAYSVFNHYDRQALEERKLSPPDAVYTSSDGRVVAYEVITNNYGVAEIQSKENFAIAFGVELQTCKI